MSRFGSRRCCEIYDRSRTGFTVIRSATGSSHVAKKDPEPSTTAMESFLALFIFGLFLTVSQGIPLDSSAQIPDAVHSPETRNKRSVFPCVQTVFRIFIQLILSSITQMSNLLNNHAGLSLQLCSDRPFWISSV